MRCTVLGLRPDEWEMSVIPCSGVPTKLDKTESARSIAFVPAMPLFGFTVPPAVLPILAATPCLHLWAPTHLATYSAIERTAYEREPFEVESLFHHMEHDVFGR